MFLIRDGKDLVFLHRDPRHEGYPGDVEEDVVLYYPQDVHRWPDSSRQPQIVLGVSPKNKKLYQVFAFEEDCRDKGYKKVATGTPWIFESWSKYLLNQVQHKLMPEHAAEHVAINLENGEFVLGKTSPEVLALSDAKWPGQRVHRCRVDGSPSIKFHR